MLQFRYPSTVKPVRVALVEPVAYQGAVNGYQYNIGKDLKAGDIVMLPEAQAIYDERRKTNSFDNPWAQCFPGGVPRAFLSPDPFKILYIPVPQVTVILFEAVQT